ncbi:MAG: gsiB 1 [Conexibacter sp.]|nr:gsiB 1 [Conexibacter sp.]
MSLEHPAPSPPADTTRGRARLVGLAAALAIASTLSACGGGGASGGSDSASAGTAAGSGAASGSATPVRGGTIRYGHEQEPPCLTGGWVQEAYIDRQLLDSLVAQEKGGKIVPWLATSWKVSKDQRTWTFTLKPGIRFTDGTPLDAAAVAKNFSYWLDPRTGNSTVQSYIGGYYASSRALDATTLQLDLKKPYSPLLSSLSQAYFGIVSPQTLASGADAVCTAPVGSGPFILQKWNRGQNLTFVRNPSYDSAPANAKHQGPAYVDGIVWKFLGDQTVRYGSLTNHQSDVIYDVPTVDWQEAKARFEVQQYITPGTPVRLSLNTSRAPFDDVAVRRAFAYATDRANGVKSAFNGVIPYNGNGALSQSTPDYDASLANAYAYDPGRANSLLDAAGWSAKDGAGYRTKNGRELTVKLVYPAGSVITSEGVTLLQNIQQQAKQVGFHVDLVPATPSETFSGRYSTPDSYDAQPWYWTSPNAGVLYIVWRQNLKDSPNGNNESFYNNPELDRTIAAANSTLDPAKQKQLYARAQQIIVAEAAVVGLYTQTTSLAIDRRLRDVWLEDSQGEPVFSDAYFAR